MALFNNPAEIIIEAGNLDLETSGNIMIETAANEFTAECSEIPTLEEDAVFYTEEVVPVFGVNKVTGIKAVVELESVVKFMNSNDIEDIADAVTKIAEHYELNATDLGIVIESNEELEETVQEAKVAAKKGLKKALGKVGDAANALKDIKNKGIKVFKKKPNKKKK